MATLTQEQRQRPSDREHRGGPGRTGRIWMWLVMALAVVAVGLALATFAPTGDSVIPPAGATDTETEADVVRRLVNEGYLPKATLSTERSETDRLVNEGKIPAGTSR